MMANNEPNANKNKSNSCKMIRKFFFCSSLCWLELVLWHRKSLRKKKIRHISFVTTCFAYQVQVYRHQLCNHRHFVMLCAQQQQNTYKRNAIHQENYLKKKFVAFFSRWLFTIFFSFCTITSVFTLWIHSLSRKFIWVCLFHFQCELWSEFSSLIQRFAFTAGLCSWQRLRLE